MAVFIQSLRETFEPDETEYDTYNTDVDLCDPYSLERVIRMDDDRNDRFSINEATFIEFLNLTSGPTNKELFEEILQHSRIFHSLTEENEEGQSEMFAKYIALGLCSLVGHIKGEPEHEFHTSDFARCILRAFRNFSRKWQREVAVEPNDILDYKVFCGIRKRDGVNRAQEIVKIILRQDCITRLQLSVREINRGEYSVANMLASYFVQDNIDYDYVKVSFNYICDVYQRVESLQTYDPENSDTYDHYNGNGTTVTHDTEVLERLKNSLPDDHKHLAIYAYRKTLIEQQLRSLEFPPGAVFYSMVSGFRYDRTESEPARYLGQDTHLDIINIYVNSDSSDDVRLLALEAQDYVKRSRKVLETVKTRFARLRHEAQHGPVRSACLRPLAQRYQSLDLTNVNGMTEATNQCHAVYNEKFGVPERHKGYICCKQENKKVEVDSKQEEIYADQLADAAKRSERMREGLQCNDLANIVYDTTSKLFSVCGEHGPIAGNEAQMLESVPIEFIRQHPHLVMALESSVGRFMENESEERLIIANQQELLHQQQLTRIRDTGQQIRHEVVETADVILEKQIERHNNEIAHYEQLAAIQQQIISSLNNLRVTDTRTHLQESAAQNKQIVAKMLMLLVLGFFINSAAIPLLQELGWFMKDGVQVYKTFEFHRLAMSICHNMVNAIPWSNFLGSDTTAVAASPGADGWFSTVAGWVGRAVPQAIPVTSLSSMARSGLGLGYKTGSVVWGGISSSFFWGVKRLAANGIVRGALRRHKHASTLDGEEEKDDSEARVLF